MIHIMNEDEKKLMRQVEKITDTDFEFEKSGKISTDYLFEAIKYLVWKIEDLEDQIITIEEDIAENYEPKYAYDNPYDEIGMRQEDFM